MSVDIVFSSNIREEVTVKKEVHGWHIVTDFVRVMESNKFQLTSSLAHTMKMVDCKKVS
jgi:hypothetical protein